MSIPKKAISGIYKIFWNNNNYFYYGQAIHISGRIRKHNRLLKMGNHYNIKLQNIYNKYGTPTHEIVKKCSNEELDINEQYYIDLYFKDRNCCNRSPTASSNKGMKLSEETKLKIAKQSLGRTHTEETKKAIGEKQMGCLNHSYGKKLTDEHKAKIKISRIGSKLKEETKIKIGNKHRGKIISQETRNKLRNKLIGKKHSNETKQKISAGHKGKILSEETKIKIGNANRGLKRSAEVNLKNGLAHSGEKSGVAKLVLNTETGIFYSSIREAWASMGIHTFEYLGYKLKHPEKNNTSFIFA